MWAGMWDSDRHGAVSPYSAAIYRGRKSFNEAAGIPRGRQALIGTTDGTNEASEKRDQRL